MSRSQEKWFANGLFPDLLGVEVHSLGVQGLGVGLGGEQAQAEHQQGPGQGRHTSGQEGGEVAPELGRWLMLLIKSCLGAGHLVIDDARHGRSCGHGDGEEPQQRAYSLAGALGPAQVEGDGADEGDEAAVEEPHHSADQHQHLVPAVDIL